MSQSMLTPNDTDMLVQVPMPACSPTRPLWQRLSAYLVLTLFSATCALPPAYAVDAIKAARKHETFTLPAGVVPLKPAPQVTVTSNEGGLVTPAGQSISARKPAAHTTPESSTASPLAEVDDLVHAIISLNQQANQQANAKPTNNPVSTNSKAAQQQVQAQTQAQAQLQSKLTQLRAKLTSLSAAEATQQQQFAAIGQNLKTRHLPPEILARQETVANTFAQRAAEFASLRTQFESAIAANSSAKLTPVLEQIARFVLAHPSQNHPEQDEAVSGVSGTNSTPNSTTPAQPLLPWSSTRHARNAYTSPLQYGLSRDLGHSFGQNVQVAAAGSISGITLPDTTLPAIPTADDLAATEDAPQTAAIQALATRLNNNPVLIYNWIRNNIQFVPGYGSLQGAALTLSNQRGNAFDIASLLVATYRSAGIPARYTYGTISLGSDRLANWFGNISPDQIGPFLTQLGIPNTVNSAANPAAASSKSTVQIEHIWVQAYVDYAPSRGAINQSNTRDLWIQLDPSFKVHQYSAGTANLSAVLGIDSPAILDSAKQGAQCTADTAKNLNQSNVSSAITGYQSRFNTYIANQGPDLTVSGLIGSKTLKAENYGILLGTLPYQTIATGAVMTSIPDSLRWKFRYQLYASASARLAGNATVQINQSLPKLLGHRITLAYNPATAADATTLASYLPTAHADGTPIQPSEFPANLPGYLINVAPTLSIDGTAVTNDNVSNTGTPASTATPLTLGQSLIGTAAFYNPALGGWVTVADHSASAGEYQAIALDGLGIGSGEIDALNTRITATQAQLTSKQYTSANTSLSRDNTVGDTLYQLGLGYFATADANASLFARAAGVIDVRQPSMDRAIAKVEPTLAYGIVTQVAFPGIALAVDRLSNATASANTTNTTTNTTTSSTGINTTSLTLPVYQRQANERNSAYAHLILEQLLTDTQRPGQAASTIRNLTLANAQSKTIARINSGNISNSGSSTPFTQINSGSDTTADVQNAATNGLTVLISQTPVTITNTRTVGSGSTATTFSASTTSTPYSLEDPATAAAAYKLGNPGNSAASANISASTAAILYTGAMGNLALGQPNQTATALIPTQAAAKTLDTALSIELGDVNSINSTRIAYYPGNSEIANGLFLAALANGLTSANISSSGNTLSTDPCAMLTGVIAANLATGTGTGSTGTGGSGNTTPNTPVRAPVITSNPVLVATAGVAYSYAFAASDPAGLTLTYSLSNLTSAPTGMTINSSTGLVQWTTPTAGSYTVTLRADNGRAYTEQSYPLTVGAGNLPLDATISVTPQFASAGQSITVTVATNGGQGSVDHPITSSLKVDNQTVALTRTATSSTATFTAAASGTHLITAILSDARGSITRQSSYSVTNANASSTDLSVNIATPLADSEVTAPTTVTGTITDGGDGSSIAYYQLLIRPSGPVLGSASSSNPSGTPAAWQEVSRGYGAVGSVTTTPATPGPLGKFDPSTLENGIWDLGVNVVNVNGQNTSQIITLDVDRARKLGQFNISFEDLNIQASGIPVRITRTYDTRKKGDNLDFGYGWTVDYQSAVVRKNGPTGQNWGDSKTAGQLSVCLRPTASRKVNITLPTGKVERFTAANAIECAQGTPPQPDVIFNPLAGTTSQLEAVNVPDLIYQGEIIDSNTGAAWDPHDFKLTSEDGYIYYVSEGIGIQQIKDPFGNTLTYGNNGIVHSAGLSIAFTRDASNRITSITDPAGKTINYAYSAAGDLQSVTNRNGEVSQLGYDQTHGLTSYTDPSGTVIAKYTYDDQGRLIAATDAQGKAILTTHDTDNNREIVTDRNGNQTVYVYDDAGDVISITNALNQTTVYTYDALGNETSSTDALGNVVRHTYDPITGKMLSETDALGNTTTYTYDASNTAQLNSSSDASGNVTNYLYSASNGQIYGIANPNGDIIYALQNGKGNLVAQGLAGQQTQYAYNNLGQTVAKTDPLGNTIQYVLDTNGNTVGSSWARTSNVAGNTQTSNVTTTSTLDAQGRLISETDELGNTATTTYNSAGKIAQQTDAQGRVTTYSYDSSARVIQTTYPDNTTENTTYDAAGNIVAQTDRQGRVTRTVYNALNRATQLIYPDGTTAFTEYDAAGRITATIDAKGGRTENTYDAAGHLIQVKDPSGGLSKYTYDATGNRTSATDAKGNVTTYQYDVLHRLIATIYPPLPGAAVTDPLPTATTVYRADGGKASETDASGNTINYSYDATSRLTTVTQTSAAGVTHTTNYHYDETGSKTAQTDAEGRTTNWAFDNANCATQRILPLGQSESFAYDPSGNVIGHTDFTGKTVATTYDNVNRPVAMLYADATRVLNTYTSAGLVATTTVSGATSASGLVNGKTSFTYNALNKLLSRQNPDGSGLNWQYDANGNRTSVSTTHADGSSGGTTAYTYDTASRLASVTDPLGQITQYGYDSSNNVTSIVRPNSTRTDKTYDGNNRTIQIVHSQAGKPISAMQYGLAANGQRIRKDVFDANSTLTGTPGQGSLTLTNPATTTTWAYDGTNRLVSETVTDDRQNATARQASYIYDKVGNRTGKTETIGSQTTVTAYTYDANDRLTREDANTGGTTTSTLYTWDNNGNLLSKQVGSGINSTTVYGWDNAGHLISVKQGASIADAQSQAPTATYGYDAQGNRIQKAVYSNGQVSQTINYLIDTNLPYAQAIEEQQNTATTNTQGSVSTQNTRYVWGIGLIEQNRGGQGAFYLQDHLGSVATLTDANGNVTDSYDYDAFGNVEAHSGTTTNAYRYTGEYFDDAANLQYNRARWYQPSVGRFTGIDPYRGRPSAPLSLNKYLYAEANTVNRLDPSGKDVAGLLIMSGGALVVAAILLTMAAVSPITMGNGMGKNAPPPILSDSETQGTPEDPCDLDERLCLDSSSQNNANWSNPTSTKTYGHTFTDHGMKRSFGSLVDRANGLGIPQGQWLDNARAADLIKNQALRAGSGPAGRVIDFQIPQGVGQIITGDGNLIQTNWARVILRSNGLVKTAFPILPPPAP